jgi:hypothetical protein
MLGGHLTAPSDRWAKEQVKMAAERVKRLKDLIDTVMRLPESPDRDRLLSEIRSRAVDVDTGVAPRAMLPPLFEPTQAAAAAPKRRNVAPPRRSAQPTPALHSQDWSEVFNGAAHLSLDDSPSRDDGRTARPWTLGLRG